jgi:RecA-family ATPase
MKQYGNGGFLYQSKEYSSLPDEAVTWYCHGMIGGKGKTLIVGLAKTAKTIFAILLAKAMATGTDMLGYPTVKCRVLYVVLERQRDFKRKYAEIVGTDALDNIQILDYRKPLILDSASDMRSFDLLQTVIRDNHPDVVIIDSKYRTTSKKEIDEQALKNWINNLDRLMEKEGCALVILHHSPKQEYDDLVNRGAGSSILARWVDVIIGVRRVNPKDRKDPRRYIEFVSNAGDEPDTLQVKITDAGMEEIQGPDWGKVADAIDILQKDIEANPDERITPRIRRLVSKKHISERTFWLAWSVCKP